MSQIHQILKQYWRYDNFRPLQEDIIKSVLAGNDTLALLPTGGGKSICFQIPGLALDGLTLVITPLIALMKDQTEQLVKRGISAAAIHSGMSMREIDIVLGLVSTNKIKFLYVSPERLEVSSFRERMMHIKPVLIAVDEAHCISQWGYDFRPSYQKIAEFRSLFPGSKMIAVTASATEEVKKDIVEKLKLKNVKVFQKSFSRSNLSYSCLYEENKEKRIGEILSKVGGSAIVYVRSRKQTVSLARELNKRNIRAEFYHAGLSSKERENRQDEWINNRVRVMVATNAFGMGIDKSDVRTVLHYGLPENIESYYQEAGRAGRDEKKSFAILLYDHQDINLLHDKIATSYPPTDFIKKVYQCLANFYHIPENSGEFVSRDFDLDEIVRNYDLPRNETFHAMKRMETEGFLQMTDGFYAPSKLFFDISYEDLYKFQIEHPSLDAFIKAILRLYGGDLYTSFVTISESNIARQIHTTREEVVKTLKQLQKMKVMVYEQQKDKPQLTLLTPRYDAAYLPLDVKKIEARKKNDETKASAMVNYVKQELRCRSLLLQEYFGEISDKECGICDICVRKKQSLPKPEKLEQFRNKIFQTLKERPMLIEELVNKISPKDSEALISLIREMIDQKELNYDKQGRIVLA